MPASAAASALDASSDDTTGDDARVIDMATRGRGSKRSPKTSTSSASGTTKAKHEMSDEHKEALATGRNQSRAVKAYLAAIKVNKPKRGRKRTTESIQARLAKIADDLPTADALQEVLLLQEQANLEKELVTIGKAVDLSELEAAFIAVGLAYSRSKGIDYSTWHKIDMSAETLAKAGITRS